MMTLEDVNRRKCYWCSFILVANYVTTVSYGEEIHRDLTVCVRCVCDGHDLTSCGWIFKCEYGKYPIQSDLGFFPSDQLPVTNITQPCSVNDIVNCKNLIIGKSGRLSQGEIHGLEGAKAFLR